MTAAQQQFETATPQESKIVPTDKDVLTTAKIAARRYEFHVGTRRYKAMIEATKVIYQQRSATKASKSYIIESIVKSIHEAGGRFICVDDSTNEWSVMPLRKVTDKISHALRKPLSNSTTKKKRRKGYNAALEVFPMSSPTGPVVYHEDDSRDDNSSTSFAASPDVMSLKHASLGGSSTIDGRKMQPMAEAMLDIISPFGKPAPIELFWGVH